MKQLPIGPSRDLSISPRLSEILIPFPVPCVWCGMAATSSCLICSGCICGDCVRLSAHERHICRKCYRDAVEYACDLIARVNGVSKLLGSSRITSPMWIWRWWGSSNWLKPIRSARWWLRWRLRGHSRNHDPAFCAHPSKAWRWRTEDGCEGQVCDWCYMLVCWCPTSMPDVRDLARLGADGNDLPNWNPPPLVDRLVDPWEMAEQDEAGSLMNGQGPRAHKRVILKP